MEKRKYKDFGKKHYIQNIYLFIPIAFLFWLAWTNFQKQNALFWISITLIVLGIIGGLIWDKKRINRFRCPQCNRIITNPTITERKEGDPINYACPVCNIEWETGLTEGKLDG
ncbi:MAG: hypothetical protein JXL81_11540 [Deltaproteobacteria bacterium]|nr:hypothetical protein [Deltaproteobacteria bacterium]